MAYGGTWARRLYNDGPPFFRNVIATGYGFYHRRRKYGPHFARWMTTLRAAERAPMADVVAQRDRLLRAFVTKAVEQTPFWSERFRSAGVRAEDVRTASDLSALPLLTKEDVRERLADLWPAWVRRGGVVWFHTSGTTGKALSVPISQACFEREYAFRWLHYGWCGISRRDRVATFAGHPVVPPKRRAPPYWVYNWAERQMLFSSQHLGPVEGGAVAAALERFQPALIHGYPSSVALAAHAVLEHRRTVRPVAVYTASETLMDAQVRLLREAFECPVMNWYGNTEMVANIISCPMGGLHVQPLHSVVEILASDGGPARLGEVGELVCTGFGNAAMPLLRYRTGDMAIRGEGQCACGRSAPTVEGVTGRVEDYVVTPRGRLVGRLDHVFKDTLTIREAQIEQLEDGSLVIRLATREDYVRDRDESAISAALRERLESEMQWRFQYVHTIPRGANNKFRFVISHVRSQWAQQMRSTVVRDHDG